MAARQNGPVPLARLLRGSLDPVIAKRGFATADLLAAWDAVVGPRYAAFTEPERIVWPRVGGDGRGTLTVRVDGARAIYLQHEREQFIGRINQFLGHDAIGDIRIVQRVRVAKPSSTERHREPDAAEAATVRAAVETVEGDALREALGRLGAAILRDRLARE